MSASKSSLELDHLVYVLPTAQFENPQAWLADNFTIITGGTHADGCSRNKLIIFEDGTYIELLDWIDKQGTMFQDWVDRGNGWVDFALTSSQESAKGIYEKISKGLQRVSESTISSDLTYREPKPGGRKKPDGVEIKWETFRPSKPLAVPFFCHDVTDRTLRVPHRDTKITKHPCGAKGISQIEICVDAQDRNTYAATYEAVLGVASRNNGSDSIAYPIRSPEEVEGVETTIVLTTKRSDEKAGIRSITVSAHNGFNDTNIRLDNQN